MVSKWGVAFGLLMVGGSGTTSNPFAEHPFYLNPVNQREYDQSIKAATNSMVKANLETMRGIASAYWIDKKDKIKGSTTLSVQGILADAASKSPPELVVLIWYDFPNRDCAAAASAGEICCAYKADGTCDWGNGGDCASGINEYNTEYVDPFIEVLVEYKGKVPVVIVFEPDSLPNFATNLDNPHCGALETRNAYHEGAKYALNELTSKTDATVYIDAAHGGWIGWDKNMMKFMATLWSLGLPWEKIRGFSTNVAGYQPLGQMCPWMPDPGQPYRNGYCLNGKHKEDACCSDPCGLLSQYDPADNELNFAQELHQAAKGELGMDAHIIIDTGRNGVPGPREDCSHWCNVRGAGAGFASTAAVPAPTIMDAFFYLKTPGESDGCTRVLPDGEACPRFDTGCGSADSIGSRPDEPRAPEAGAWFIYQVQQLAENADFGSPFVPTVPSPTSSPAAPQSTERQLAQPAPAAGLGAAFSQCGGKTWRGSTACQPGCTCVASGDYYSECTPPVGAWSCGMAAVDASSPRKAIVGRHGRLRARRENVLLQLLGEIKRGAAVHRRPDHSSHILPGDEL